MNWEGYFTIERLENLGENNWVKLVALVDELQGIGRNSNQQSRCRPTVPPAGFSWDTGEVDEEENPILRWYGNTYVYAANFPVTAIQFEKFANKLETAFELPEGSVSYTTQLSEYGIAATYVYNNKNYFTVCLLGCSSGTQLCTTQESNQKILNLLAIEPKWGDIDG